MVADARGAEGKITFAGIDPTLPLHERLKRQKSLIEPIKDDVTDPREPPVSVVKPAASGRGTSTGGQPAAVLDDAPPPAATEAAVEPPVTQPQAATRQTAIAESELVRATETVDSYAPAAAPTAPTEAPLSAAVRAAAIPRSGRSQSLSAFDTRALGASDGTAVLAPRAGDTRVDQLIAAMAAFQGGGGVGAGDLSAAAPVDHLLAQLAPAV